MKILQINAWQFTLLDQLVLFLKEETADVVLMQEFSTGLLSKGGDINAMQILEELGYHIYFGATYGVLEDNTVAGQTGIAILSKLPFEDTSISFIPYLGGYKEYSKTEIFFDQRGKEDISYNDRLRVRSICWSYPSPVVVVSIIVSGVTYSFITTHFKASEKCTITYQMLKHAEYIAELIQDIDGPIIFGGDLNIYSDAIVLDPLREELEQITTGKFNSLNPRVHPGFKGNIPAEGYGVDHLFQRGCDAVSRRVRDDVDVSDHLPIECIIH